MVIATTNKAFFVVPERKFSQENRDLERFYLLVFVCPGLLSNWIAFDPIFPEKVVKMERAHPRENFHLGFVASDLTTTVDQSVFPCKAGANNRKVTKFVDKFKSSKLYFTL